MDSEYAPAIGAAILGAVSGGAHNSINDAVDAMKSQFYTKLIQKRKSTKV